VAEGAAHTLQSKPLQVAPAAAAVPAVVYPWDVARHVWCAGVR
jgi:hypothetical protein